MHVSHQWLRSACWVSQGLFWFEPMKDTLQYITPFWTTDSRWVLKCFCLRSFCFLLSFLQPKVWVICMSWQLPQMSARTRDRSSLKGNLFHLICRLSYHWFRISQRYSSSLVLLWSAQTWGLVDNACASSGTQTFPVFLMKINVHFSFQLQHDKRRLQIFGI